MAVHGIRGPSGTKYILIESEGVAACIPLNNFVEERAAKRELVDQGIPIIGQNRWRKLLDKVSDVIDFPYAPVIEKVGWNASHFALPDGSVFPCDEGARAPTSIDIVRGKCDKLGTLKQWRNQVSKPLKKQPFATFLLMTAFMPPILELSSRYGNIGFEIVGGKGTGKSTLQYLVASAYGDIRQSTRGHYWTTLDTTFNGLEAAMKSHADLLIIMDEANLLAADAAPKVRSDLFKALAFKLGSGSIKDRYNQSAETDYRLGFIISSNEPLAQLLGQGSESARAAADRLLTLPVGADKKHGIFDVLPHRYSSGSAFAQALLAAAEKNHGHAMPRYLSCLVEAKKQDEGSLRKDIQAYLEDFRKHAGVNLNDGSAVRVADAFGLVYAAGALAKKYGVLHKRLKPGAAALHCYRLHIEQMVDPQIAFIDRLRLVAEDDRILTISATMPIEAEAIGYIHNYKGTEELLVQPKMIETVFPDWQAIKDSAEVRRTLKVDGKHMQAKRKIGQHKRSRMYCFKLCRGKLLES